MTASSVKSRTTTTAKAPAKKTKPSATRKTPPSSVKPSAKPLQATPVEVPLATTEKSKPAKEKKVKVVRDSFTIPKTEFTQIADMKKRAMALGVEIKKSELIRAGLQIISGLPDASFKKALAAIPTVKTGRPSKA
ncbi:hypothetical protein [Limnohabitans sp.]|uniref:hypothetical protein n=1 Tax=Limnohabitans sp. TaxID=1907725 RepID=UPI00261C1368|nr:hypothetical protein [Limnohabitans sp.]